MALWWQIKELKSRLQEENTESDVSVKEELITLQDSEYKMVERISTPPPETAIPGSDSRDLNYDCFQNGDGLGSGVVAASLFPVDHFKDGSSDDSDSSAILNEENNNSNSPNNNGAISSSGVLQSHSLLMSSSPSSSSMSCFQFQKQYQAQYVKMEEHNFLSADEACNFFSDEQAPTLQQWYCSDEWN